MSHFISISIPTQVFIDLLAYLREYGDARDPSDVATMAIRSWLAAAMGEPGAMPVDGARGYQWKGLFLPEGSELRMQYQGEYAYARVVGDAITYQGRQMTPAQLVNSIAGGTRNAWRDLWIRLPGERQWKSAAFQRLAQKKVDAQAPPEFRLQAPATASAVMAESLKNALALIEKATAHRSGRCDRRTDTMPDD